MASKKYIRGGSWIGYTCALTRAAKLPHSCSYKVGFRVLHSTPEPRSNVLRGGSWFDLPAFALSTFSWSSLSEIRILSRGFRVTHHE